MFNPKISIIIPVYNGANYMREAIDSALAQTYKNIEIIVVNDGSTDEGETDRIALSYGDKIRYIKKENGGSSSALNVGIKNMTGDYFSWLSHDDLYLPQRTEVMVNSLIEGKDDCVVICGVDLIDKDGNPIYHPSKGRKGIFFREEMFEFFRFGNAINGCTIIIPKSMIDKTGFFDESLCYVNDVEFWHRLIISGGTYVIIEDKLIKTRIHGEQVSVKKAGIFKKERKIFARKIFDLLLKNIDENKALITTFLKKSAYDYNMSEVNDAILRLKEEKKFDYSLYVPIYWNYLYGKILKSVKYIYRKLFFKR